MAKKSLSEQLDEAVEALHTQPEANYPRASARVAPLVRLADELRHIPRNTFRARLKTELERRASMTATAKQTPEKGRVSPVPRGHHTAAPYLCVKGAASAIEFYTRAFGAQELLRLADPDGRIAHAEIKIGDSIIMLGDESPEHGRRGPFSFGGSPAFVHLYVEDADALARRAVAAGAKVLRPVENQIYGDRSGSFADPFGYTWEVGTHIEDVAPEEIQRRAAVLMETKPKSEVTQQDPAAGVSRVRPIPEGFHTVTAYLTARQAPELLEFVKRAFGAEEQFRGTGSAGGMHAEVRIGDSMLMIGGGGAWQGTPMTTGLHLYVPDTDATYKLALGLGAISLHEPMDQNYGERSAAVKDVAGNHWYIATHTGPTAVPQGLRSLNVYLHPRGADQLINFLKRAFGAEEVARYASADGIIQHAQAKIGDSVIEMGEAHGQYQPMPTMFYLYVEDADALYARATREGAISISPPTDQPYGDRSGGVSDPFGNQWYIATHIKDRSS
jgi:PhnB protein